MLRWTGVLKAGFLYMGTCLGGPHWPFTEIGTEQQVSLVEGQGSIRHPCQPHISTLEGGKLQRGTKLEIASGVLKIEQKLPPKACTPSRPERVLFVNTPTFAQHPPHLADVYADLASVALLQRCAEVSRRPCPNLAI